MGLLKGREAARVEARHLREMGVVSSSNPTPKSRLLSLCAGLV